MAPSGWTSLEMAKLVVGVLTPLAVAVLGLVVARAGRRSDRVAAEAAARAEAAQWANRRAVERLIELHKEMAPLMNDLMCFFGLIGHFREIDPHAAVARKRRLDRIYFANEQLFSADFRDTYRVFMDSCFAHWQTAGRDAKMKTSRAALRAERGPDARWDQTWNRLFDDVPDPFETRHRQREAYAAAMSAFADQLGLRPPGPAASDADG